ncbi:MAG: LysM peptidoglycan-binding domain-containing protein [Actinomycetia bacterium]|nr:LysM peptidoglycan-binding domain-containing protein [Actinomycetes bacterium]
MSTGEEGRMSRRILTAAGNVGLALLLASCGGSDAPAAVEPTTPSIQPTVAPVVVTTTTTTIAGPEMYVVQTGDSLGAIASRFDVTLADLVAVNAITDPDKIAVGQELLIPDGTTPMTTTTSAETTTTTAG